MINSERGKYMKEIYSRRSIRKYKSTDIDMDTIKAIVEAVALGYGDESPARRPRKKLEDILTIK